MLIYISAGQLELNNKHYFAISVSSPVGKLLLGKQAGDTVSWNGKKINIYTIS